LWEHTGDFDELDGLLGGVHFEELLLWLGRVGCVRGLWSMWAMNSGGFGRVDLRRLEFGGLVCEEVDGLAGSFFQILVCAS
jgi:hypothetical protein